MEDDQSSSRTGVDSSMAQSTKPQQAFRFLDLPRELQHMAMDNVFQPWEFKFILDQETRKYFVHGPKQQPYTSLLVSQYFYTSFKDRWVSSFTRKITVYDDSGMPQEKGPGAGLSEEALSRHVQKFGHNIKSIVTSTWSANFKYWANILPNLRSFQAVSYAKFQRGWDMEHSALDVHLLDLVQGRLDHEFQFGASIAFDACFKNDTRLAGHKINVDKNSYGPSIQMTYALIFEFKKGRRRDPRDHWKLEFQDYNMPGGQFVSWNSLATSHIY